MVKAGSQKEAQEYLDDLVDWQEHQYSPGRYLGGNLPFPLKHRLGKYKGIRIYIIIYLLIVFAAVVFALYQMVVYFAGTH